MQDRTPRRPRTRYPRAIASSFQSFCSGFEGSAGSREHPGWVRHLDRQDLKRWVAELWPIPPLASLSIRTWARYCYRRFAAGDSQRLAS